MEKVIKTPIIDEFALRQFRKIDPLALELTSDPRKIAEKSCYTGRYLVKKSKAYSDGDEVPIGTIDCRVSYVFAGTTYTRIEPFTVYERVGEHSHSYLVYCREEMWNDDGEAIGEPRPAGRMHISHQNSGAPAGDNLDKAEHAARVNRVGGWFKFDISRG